MTTTQEFIAVPLQEWAKVNEPPDNMIHKGGYWTQIIFVREVIASLIAKTFDEYKLVVAGIKVIATHSSKSICLPVFRIELSNGMRFTMRYNFHDWKVSVESPIDIEADFMGLFDPTTPINKVYCEGFPEEAVFGPYAENKRRFTIELSAGENHLFTFFWIFGYKVLGVKTFG